MTFRSEPGPPILGNRVEKPVTTEVFICDFARTPIGRFGGALAKVRADDLGSIPLRALLRRNPGLPATDIDEIYFGCVNQAGEDNRNVARMSALLAGIPVSVPASTINRLCGSGMDAMIAAARAIIAGDADVVIAAGTESMSRAPFVMAKAESAFSRSATVYDSTIGWRFPNKEIERLYGIDSMPETAENVAEEYSISRADQDRFALGSQLRAARARDRLAMEIEPVVVAGRRGQTTTVTLDEHPRQTTLEALANLPTPFREGGTVTAGNSSGVNDGAAALLLASGTAVSRYGLKPLARYLASATAGVEPRIMGIGPVPATRKLAAKSGLSVTSFDIIELNEAFASQSLAVLRSLGIDDQDDRVNPNGGAIALGHPLGMSGARIAGTAALELSLQGKSLALATMCIGVGQGIAVAIGAA